MKRLQTDGTLVNSNIRDILELDYYGINLLDRISIMKILNSVEIDILNRRIFNIIAILSTLLIATIVSHFYGYKYEAAQELTTIFAITFIIVISVVFPICYKSYRDSFILFRLKRDKLNSLTQYSLIEIIKDKPQYYVDPSRYTKLLKYKNRNGNNIDMVITVDFSSNRQYRKYKKRIKEEFDLERYINKQELINSKL